ncbi:hypothetical protein BDQ17DRAFT_1336791 [Cyathus striatus]|nr:hypothetical protein BDQ17DRAFT_1336791 [Cyathus striatus]
MRILKSGYGGDDGSSGMLTGNLRIEDSDMAPVQVRPLGDALHEHVSENGVMLARNLDLTPWCIPSAFVRERVKPIVIAWWSSLSFAPPPSTTPITSILHPSPHLPTPETEYAYAVPTLLNEHHCIPLSDYGGVPVTQVNVVQDSACYKRRNDDGDKEYAEDQEGME